MTFASNPALPSAPNSPSVSKEWLRALEKTAPIGNVPARVFPTVMDEVADRFGNAAALLSRDEKMTYGELAQQSNRYARWALAQGIKKGDAVALLMPNRPRYFAIWLGVTRIGGVVALLNTSLAGAGLAHCINIVAPKHIIVDREFVGSSASVLEGLDCSPTIWNHSVSDQHSSDDLELDRYSGQQLTKSERPDLTTNDKALYIYTSGTTGLPKAAIVDHYRLMMWTHWFAAIMDTKSDDRMYNTLPMYHSIGGAVATGAVLLNGGSVVIEKRFSATQFWKSVVEWDCTLFQYIGELCRYLLEAPIVPQELQHRLRLCCGNGLRMDVWKPFKDRFHIPRILEFYAATEGNVSLYNLEGVPGSIGRIPPFLKHRFPIALIRLAAETSDPVRDEDGFCIACGPDEPGEALGKIRQETSSTGSRFEGYLDKNDTEKKILYNVFVQGDAWFRTGDLMRKDNKGYFYFVDRIGDTFRWKGENVSTTEVSGAISDFPEIAEATVYGVIVPKADGRAGMAAIVARGPIDMAAFHQHLTERLASYAIPLFVRLTSQIDSTATFKQVKNRLSRESYDPTATSDEIYFRDSERKTFVRMDKAAFCKNPVGSVASLTEAQGRNFRQSPPKPVQFKRYCRRRPSAPFPLCSDHPPPAEIRQRSRHPRLRRAASRRFAERPACAARRRDP